MMFGGPFPHVHANWSDGPLPVAAPCVFARCCNGSVAAPCVWQGAATDPLQHLAFCKVLQRIRCSTLQNARCCNRPVAAHCILSGAASDLLEHFICSHGANTYLRQHLSVSDDQLHFCCFFSPAWLTQLRPIWKH